MALDRNESSTATHAARFACLLVWRLIWNVQRPGDATLRLSSSGGGPLLVLLHDQKDAAADQPADAAERQQAANCERGTRHTVQAEQGRAVAV